MSNYTFHPEPTCGIEIRDGWTEDDYIAQARGFRSTAQWLEYRDASPERRTELRQEHDRESRESDEGDLARYAEFLRLKDHE